MDMQHVLDPGSNSVCVFCVLYRQKSQFGPIRTILTLVRIENPELSDCSLAPLKVNYLYSSQETTILHRVRF
jgi:hypothetical protein